MTKLLLREAIPALLCESESTGLKPATIKHYQRAYRILEEYAKGQGQTEVSHELEESFLSIQTDKLNRSVLHPREFRTYRRAARILTDYGTANSFIWKTYYFIERQMPNSPQYQTFQKKYLTYLNWVRLF